MRNFFNSIKKFFNPENILERRIKFIEHQIGSETQDLRAFIKNKKTQFGKSTSVFDFYESVQNGWQNKLIDIKSSFIGAFQSWADIRYKFFSFVLPKEEFEKLSDETIAAFETGSDNFQTNKNKSFDLGIPPNPEIIFTPSDSGPIYWVQENQAIESETSYGERYADLYMHKQQQSFEEDVDLPKPNPEFTTEIKTRETLLSSIKLWEIIIAFGIIVLAIIPEFIIFQNIVSTIFRLTGIKALFTGFIIILFGKTISLVIYKTTHSFLRDKSHVLEIRKKTVNVFFVAICVTSILYCFSIGMLFSGFSQRQEDVKTYTLYQTKAYQQAEKSVFEGQDSQDLAKQKETAQRMEVLENKIFNDKPSLLKKITIGLSGSVTLIFSSILLSMALVMINAFRLRKKLESCWVRIEQAKSDFYQYKTTIPNFRIKARKIISLYGRLEFLKRLQDRNVNPYNEPLFDPRRKKEEFFLNVFEHQNQTH